MMLEETPMRGEGMVSRGRPETCLVALGLGLDVLAWELWLVLLCAAVMLVEWLLLL